MWEAYANVHAAYVAAAVTCAFHAPAPQRRAARVLGLALLGNWLTCGLPYVRDTVIDPVDLWAVMDATLGAVAITLSRRWWGWAVWALAVCQVCFHLCHGLLEDALYTWWLDRLLEAMVAVFLLLGGRGVYDWFSGLGAARPWRHWLVRRAVGVLPRVVRWSWP